MSSRSRNTSADAGSAAWGALRDLIQADSRSQAEIADAAGVGASTLSRALRGKVDGTLVEFLAVCAVLDVDPLAILRDVELMPIDKGTRHAVSKARADHPQAPERERERERHRPFGHGVSRRTG